MLANGQTYVVRYSWVPALPLSALSNAMLWRNALAQCSGTLLGGQNNDLLVRLVVSDIYAFGYIIFQMFLGIIEMETYGRGNYFSNLWNIVDCILCIVILLLSVLRIWYERVTVVEFYPQVPHFVQHEGVASMYNLITNLGALQVRWGNAWVGCSA